MGREEPPPFADIAQACDPEQMSDGAPGARAEGSTCRRRAFCIGFRSLLRSCRAQIGHSADAQRGEPGFAVRVEHAALRAVLPIRRDIRETREAADTDESITPKKGHTMARDVSVALLVRIEAMPGKEQDVVDFLRQGLSLVQEEPDTVRWFGIRFGPSSFGIFDAFPDESGRQAHLNGKVARALQENIGTLFEPPSIEQVDVLAERPPE